MSIANQLGMPRQISFESERRLRPRSFACKKAERGWKSRDAYLSLMRGKTAYWVEGGLQGFVDSPSSLTVCMVAEDINCPEGSRRPVN